jgi:hypothetical protein
MSALPTMLHCMLKLYIASGRDVVQELELRLQLKIKTS